MRHAIHLYYTLRPYATLVINFRAGSITHFATLQGSSVEQKPPRPSVKRRRTILATSEVNATLSRAKLVLFRGQGETVLFPEWERRCSRYECPHHCISSQPVSRKRRDLLVSLTLRPLQSVSPLPPWKLCHISIAVTSRLISPQTLRKISRSRECRANPHTVISSRHMSARPSFTFDLRSRLDIYWPSQFHINPSYNMEHSVFDHCILVCLTNAWTCCHWMKTLLTCIQTRAGTKLIILWHEQAGRCKKYDNLYRAHGQN